MIELKKIALEFINLIENFGYKAYIVGGFVRDFLMKKESYDIDITTNATPKEIQKIFSSVTVKRPINDEDNYGSVRVVYKNIIFEVTTFRKELEYLDNRHPSRIFYVDDLETDLKRRDFTINAICMDKNSNIIDPLQGKLDIQNKIIRTIAPSEASFKDDALRILRAIRFMVTLNFKFHPDIIIAIKKTKQYLKNISYERKKIELDKIFASPYAKRGIEIIKELELEEALDLKNLDRIQDYTDLIGIWAMINSDSYRFTRHEKELIKKVNIVYEMDNLDPKVLYKYGLYVNILAGINKGINKKRIIKAYSNLPIKSKSDIKVTAKEICHLLNKQPSYFLQDIYRQLEDLILTGKLENENDILLTYIQKNFKEIYI